MVDAVTQTDRSDYQLIKAKLMRERALKQQVVDQQTAALGSRKINEKPLNLSYTQSQIPNT